ncbi:MAG: addiction module toxin RelE [Caulobacteraceae bacterium]|nr:addiction module toxin RelE [Caulobacteraceae bacterium]
MPWTVILHEAFDLEYEAFPETVQDDIAAASALLAEFGPSLGRPHVDTLADSKYANMKELRFDADNGVWRVAFAFDPKRQAVLLIAGDKSGVSQKRFYKGLIAKADARFAAYLKSLKET